MNPLAYPHLQETFLGVFRLAAPEIALIGTACILFLLGAFYNRRWLGFVVSIIGVLVAARLAFRSTEMPAVLTAASIVPDAAADFIRWLALIAAAVLLFVSWGEVSSGIATEYYGCTLIAAAGASLVGRANDLMTLFLALELISIPTYILLYLPARTRQNQEAAAKYFMLSILSSAILLFGFSYLYGLTGSTNIAVVVDTLTKANADSKANPEAISPLALLGIAMVVAAMCFRIAAVPFHFYAPDVYEGAPTGVVAQLAFLPKVAGFAALGRLLGLIGLESTHLSGWEAIELPFDGNSQLPLLLWILAVLTMTLGNVLALLQDNIRRMLAYSSIAHAGYMLIGIVVACSIPEFHNAAKAGTSAADLGPAAGGMSGLLVYLAAYGTMTIGAFAVVLFLSTPERPIEAIDDLAGLGKSHPISAGAMAVFLFSLIGLPLTAGFIGKFVLFLGAFSAPSETQSMGHLYQLLAVVGAVNAAIGACYYLKVIGVMYLRTPLRPLLGSRSFPTLLAAIVLAGATLFLGIYPQPLVKAARKAAPVSESRMRVALPGN